MGADAYWRVDVDTPATEAQLAQLGAHVVALGPVEVSAAVSADRCVFFGWASFEEGPLDELMSMGEAVRDLTGGTLRLTDDFQSLGEPFDLPDDGTDLATFAPVDAPRPAPDPEPAGLDEALAKWEKGARSRGKWADLRDAMTPFVGSDRFDRVLVRDMLAASAFDDRGSSATDLLANSPGDHVTAAFVARIRRGRGQTDFHASRVAALRSLASREPERCRASLLLEARLDPALTYVRDEITSLAQRGGAPVGLLAGTLDDERAATSPLYRWRTDAELSPDARAYVAALVHHEQPKVATSAAAVLARFDLEEGLRALAHVDLTHLDALFFFRFPHEELASWRKRATRRGCSPEVAAALKAEVEALMAERGLSPWTPRPWGEVRAELTVPVPEGDWEAEEARLLEGHEAYLADVEGHAPAASPPTTHDDGGGDDVPDELEALAQQLEALTRSSSRRTRTADDRAARRAERAARRAERAARRGDEPPKVHVLLPADQVEVLLADLDVGSPERQEDGDGVCLTFDTAGADDADRRHMTIVWAAAALAAAGHRVTIRGPARPREVQLLGDHAVQPGTDRHDARNHRSLLRRLDAHLGIDGGGDRLVDRRVSRARERQQEAADAEAARSAAGHTHPAQPGDVTLSFAELTLRREAPDDDGEVPVRGDCTVALTGQGLVSQLVLRHVARDRDGRPVALKERIHAEGAAPGETVDIRPTVYLKSAVEGGESTVWVEAWAGPVVGLGPVPLPPPGSIGGDGADLDLGDGVVLSGWSVTRGPKADDDGEWRIEVTAALVHGGTVPCAGVEMTARLIRDGKAFEDRTSQLDVLLPGQSAGLDRTLRLRGGHDPDGVEVSLTLRLLRVVATVRSEPIRL